MKNISEFAADGSTLLFDFADDNLFTSKTKRVQNMTAMAAAGGEPMKSCFDYVHLEELLGEYNFLIYDFLTPDDIHEKYFKDRTDYLTAFENINYALVVLKG